MFIHLFDRMMECLSRDPLLPGCEAPWIRPASPRDKPGKSRWPTSGRGGDLPEVATSTRVGR